MGPSVQLELERHGFYPAGGGCIRVSIAPTRELQPLEIIEAAPVSSQRAIATIAGLPPSIAKREIAVFSEKLGWPEESLQIRQLQDNVGPGNIVSVDVVRANLTEVFTGFGERGVSAERVAGNTAKEVQRYLAADVPVWRFLADQLMLPLALAGGGRFRTGPLSNHSSTNADVIETFLDVQIARSEDENRNCEIRILA